VLGIACDKPRVGVDIHAHRVTNRWGYVRTRTPEQTSIAHEGKLPRRYWVEINRLLVPFGTTNIEKIEPRGSRRVMGEAITKAVPVFPRDPVVEPVYPCCLV